MCGIDSRSARKATPYDHGGNPLRTIDIAQFSADPQQYVNDSQQETIVVTRQGKPCAVLHGVEDDLEISELAHSREFWSMIEQRRREPTIPWDVAEQQLDALDQ
jgi:prevent-host-death family protein